MKKIIVAAIIMASCSTPKSDNDKMIDAEMKKNQREIDSLSVLYQKGEAKADSIALTY